MTTVKNPDGSSREFPPTTFSLSQQIMKLAVLRFEEAENIRSKDWLQYSNLFIRANKIAEIACQMETFLISEQLP